MLRKLERDFAESNLSSITGMLEKAPRRSLTRSTLEALATEAKSRLQHLEVTPDRHASTALFFSGEPVSGSRGISSEFASKALHGYQQIVSMLFALRGNGPLGERGVVPGKEFSTLHVTSLVRGSFGFLLEDTHDTETEWGDALKNVVDDSARLLGSFVDEDEEHFETAIGDIDYRVLQAVKVFFETLDKDSATLRIVAGDTERKFDFKGIRRATDRASTAEMIEVPDNLDGFLQGAMTDKREFELRVDGLGVISGKIDSVLSPEEVSRLYWSDVRAQLVRTDVYRGAQIVRKKYVMTGIQKPPAPAKKL